MNNIFNLQKFAQIKKPSIKQRHIRWQQNYPQKSGILKKMMEIKVGPNSYYRWEGHDFFTNSDYFVVVGPAQKKDNPNMFFAGIKKMPKDPQKRKNLYVPSGKYFSTIMSALTHSINKWGTTMPSQQPQYTAENIKDINIPTRSQAERQYKKMLKSQQ